MLDEEVDECAQWPEITEEELSYAQDIWNREPSVMEEIVGIIGYTYHSTFQLLESKNVNNKCLLEALRALYIFAMAEVNVAKRKRTSS